MPAGRGRPADRPRRLRHEGRPRGDDVRDARRWPSRTACACTSSCVADEERDEPEPEGLRLPRRTGLHGRLRDHRRADRPAHRRAGQGRAARCGSRSRGKAAHGSTPWEGDNAVAQGGRRVPADRVAAVRARVVRAVRPPVDQPRPDHRRRRAQQGARPLRDRRRHPLPARAGPEGDARRRSRRCPDTDVSIDLPPRPGDRRRARDPFVRCWRRRCDRGSAARPHLDRAATAPPTSSSFLERAYPRSSSAPRRRPSRPGGVGLDRLAGALPQGAGRVRRACAGDGQAGAACAMPRNA